MEELVKDSAPVRDEEHEEVTPETGRSREGIFAARLVDGAMIRLGLLRNEKPRA